MHRFFFFKKVPSLYSFNNFWISCQIRNHPGCIRLELGGHGRGHGRGVQNSGKLDSIGSSKPKFVPGLGPRLGHENLDHGLGRGLQLGKSSCPCRFNSKLDQNEANSLFYKI